MANVSAFPFNSAEQRPKRKKTEKKGYAGINFLLMDAESNTNEIASQITPKLSLRMSGKTAREIAPKRFIELHSGKIKNVKLNRRSLGEGG